MTLLTWLNDCTFPHIIALSLHIWGAKLVWDWLDKSRGQRIVLFMVGVRAGELTYHSSVISSISANLCANKRLSSKSKCHRSIRYKEIFIFESEITEHVRGRRQQNFLLKSKTVLYSSLMHCERSLNICKIIISFKHKW